MWRKILRCHTSVRSRRCRRFVVTRQERLEELYIDLTRDPARDMQAHHLNSLAQASLKGYLTTTSEQSRGVTCSYSTNRPDCQRSLCQKHSDRLLCPFQVTARPLFRHSWYYRKTRSLSSTFLKNFQISQISPYHDSPIYPHIATQTPYPLIPFCNMVATYWFGYG